MGRHVRTALWAPVGRTAYCIVWHHVRITQWGAMLELHSAVWHHVRTVQWGARLELPGVGGLARGLEP